MSEIKTQYTLKGTRIITGDLLKQKINYISKFREMCLNEGFEEVEFPNVSLVEAFSDKLGNDTSKQVYTFKDKGDRDLILNPEITALCQELARSDWKYSKDKKIFYIQRCYRGENTQRGRYREFTQLGVEILNPKSSYFDYLCNLSMNMIKELSGKDNFKLNSSAKRGLGYYLNGDGFEIECESLGGQKQICGGGEYKEGIGFGIGLDRIMLI